MLENIVEYVVILDPHTESDHQRQNLTVSTGSPPCPCRPSLADIHQRVRDTALNQDCLRDVVRS